MLDSIQRLILIFETNDVLCEEILFIILIIVVMIITTKLISNKLILINNHN